MINWHSEHDETTASGAVQRFRVGTPTKAFWTEWERDEKALTEKGYAVVETTSGRFIKAPYGAALEPPAARLPYPGEPEWLRPHQKIHVKNMWDVYTTQTSCLDGSDTGTGKTLCALAFSLMIRRRPFILCPLPAMDTWIHWCKEKKIRPYVIGNFEHFKGDNEHGKMDIAYFPGKIFWLLLGYNPPFPKFKACRSYDEALRYLFKFSILRQEHINAYEKKTGKAMRKIIRKINGYHWHVPHDAFFIVDEVHKCKGETTQNMRLLTAMKSYVNLELSATPGITPRDFKALGYTLGLHSYYDFDLWTRDHGCRQNEFKHWDYVDESKGMEMLSTELYPRRAVRMQISEIPGFPKTQITAECFTAKESKKYQALFEECLRKCELLRSEGANKLLVISQIQKFRQAAEILKIPLFVSLGNDAKENGFSVLFFMNFKESIAELVKAFPEAGLIVGGQKKKERTAAVEAFQSNQKKEIIATLQAGGASISLHDLHGGHPRMSLISPTYNPYELKQVFGRPWRDGALTTSMQRIVFMAGTEEEKVCARVRKKLDAFDVLHGLMEPSDLIEDRFMELTGEDLVRAVDKETVTIKEREEDEGFTDERGNDDQAAETEF